MFDIFFSLPRSQRSGYGCSSSELEWVASVCLSSLVPHSGGSEEAPVVLWGPADHHSASLAPEAVVSGSSQSGGRRSGLSSAVQGSSASAPLPSVSSRGVRAVPSCLETIQRFTRASGFSKHVAQQVSLARRPFSHAGYQSKWLVFRQWCHSKGHTVSRPSLAKIADFLFDSRGPPSFLGSPLGFKLFEVLSFRAFVVPLLYAILPARPFSRFPWLLQRESESCKICLVVSPGLLLLRVCRMFQNLWLKLRLLLVPFLDPLRFSLLRILRRVCLRTCCFVRCDPSLLTCQ